MFDIELAVGSLKSAIEIAKLLMDSTNSFTKAEAKDKLADLIGSLADAKMQIAQMQEALLESEKEKQELIKRMKIQGNMIYEKPYYWKMNGDEKDGPFCQKCFDSEEKLIRLQDGNNGAWGCRVCSKVFFESSYLKKSRTTISHGVAL